MGMRASLPISRLTLLTVRGALVTAWRLAASPTSRSPALVNATTEGVVRCPSALGITTGLPPSITAAQLLVVPRSMPMIFAMCVMFLPQKGGKSTGAARPVPFAISYLYCSAHSGGMCCHFVNKIYKFCPPAPKQRLPCVDAARRAWYSLGIVIFR